MNRKTRAVCAFASALLLVISAFTMFSCKKAEDYLDSTETDLKIVMKAGEFDVPYEIYRYVAESYRNQYRDEYGPGFQNGERGEELLRMFEEDVDSMIVKLYTTLQVSKEYGLDPDSEVIMTQVQYNMDDIYASYGNDYGKYLADIEEYNMNDSVYRFLNRNDILATELMEIFINRGIIKNGDADIRELFGTDVVVRVKSLLISATNGKTDEENRKLAEDLKSRLDGGEDFESLLKQYGEDLYMFNNPDGYYIVGGNFIEEFEDAAYSLGIGETSGILDTSAGYCILKRYEKEPQYLENHFDALKNMYLTGKYNLILAEAQKNMTLVKTEEFPKYQILKRASE